VQGTDRERQEEKLAEEQARGLYSFDRRDLSVELEELHERVAGVENECVTEAVQLSRSVMEISDALVDLGMFPIQSIPMQPRSAQDVLTVASHVLECLQEEHASGACPWVSNSTRPASLQPHAIPPFVFFVLLVRMYYTYLYFYICKCIRKFVSLHSHVPAPPAAMSWGS
jgi:hypothetical protein